MNVSAMNTTAGAEPASRAAALDQRFALDMQGVDALRRTVRNAPEEGLKQVSRQFEALFMSMLLKSMREATPTSGLLESQGEKVYLSLLDQQLSQNLSGRGVGLAEAMLAQLRRGLPAMAEAEPLEASAGLPLGPPAAMPLKPPAAMPLGTSPGTGATAPVLTPVQAPAPAPAAAPAEISSRAIDPVADATPPSAAVAAGGLPAHVENFVARLGTSAQAASAASGVPAPLILAQAALESGWGRREIRGDDGGQSFNLFGIKADRGWRGPVVETTTTEYVDGVARRGRAKFRAYGSYEEAFTDYARFMTRNPRYAGVLAAADPAQAAQGLQRAGYATDPRYADKLVRIMQKLA